MPAVAEIAPLHTILFGDLPLLVAREFSRLAAAASDLRLVGPVKDAELVSQAAALRPSVVIVGPQQLQVLARLSSTTRVLLFNPAGVEELTKLREGSRWQLSGVVDVLPHLLAERAAWRQALLQKLRLTANGLAAPPWLLAHSSSVSVPAGLVIIGASTGGPLAVETLLAQLRPDSRCAVVVAVHLPASFTASFVARLRRTSALPVVMAAPGSRLLPGQVAVVPGGTNMVVRRGVAGHWSTCLVPEPRPAGSDVPSVDMLMSSSAVAGSRVLGVVLTGLGHDGTRGARAIREQGGQVLVQDAATAAVFSMPGAVLRAGWASAALPLGGLAAAINDFGRQSQEVFGISRQLVFSAHAA